MDVVRISKRLSYVLRHRPDSAGLTLDPAGWADVGELLAQWEMLQNEAEQYADLRSS